MLVDVQVVVAVNLALFVGVQATDNYTVAFFGATLWGVPAGVAVLRHRD